MHKIDIRFTGSLSIRLDKLQSLFKEESREKSFVSLKSIGVQKIVLYTIIEMLQSKKAPESIGIGQFEIDNFDMYYNQESSFELHEKLMEVT
jgi:hypothetical protein